MRIVLTPEFEADLKSILKFYSKKSPEVANDFYYCLYKKLENIAFMPYYFRKNQKLNREDIRELIFKGYVISFYISANSIKILSIFKHNLPKI